MKNNSIRSPIKKAKGLGSAHHGTGHKILHNITTLTNIPLIVWVMYSIYSLRNATYEEFTTYMTLPVSIIAAILFVISILKHFALELQVVYEDYISCKCLRMVIIIGMKILFLILGIAAIVSVLKMSLLAGV